MKSICILIFFYFWFTDQVLCAHFHARKGKKRVHKYSHGVLSVWSIKILGGITMWLDCGQLTSVQPVYQRSSQNGKNNTVDTCNAMAVRDNDGWFCSP